MKKSLIITIITISVSFLFNEILNFYFIRNVMWQYEKGYKIGEGDFVEFCDKDIFIIKGKVIYYKGKPKAIIKSIHKISNRLIILSLDQTQEGEYINVDTTLE